MAALIRIRMAGRSLTALGLLMMAVVIGATGWGAQGSIVPAAGTMISGSVVPGPEGVHQSTSGAAWSSPVGGASISAKTPDATEFALLPQHGRLLVGAVIMTGLTGASLPCWAAILGLGLCASTAAAWKGLRRLLRGCRHGTRAPPLCF